MVDLPGSLTLEADGLVLRDWRTEDAPALEPVCGEWDVCGFTSVPWDYSEAEARAWVERQWHKREAGTVLALAIVADGEALPVGNVNLASFGDDGRAAAIGYWLVPSARRRGFVTRAAAELIRWSFGTLGLQRIEFEILPENLPSHRVAERLGARPEAPRHRVREADGRAYAMDVFAIER